MNWFRSFLDARPSADAHRCMVVDAPDRPGMLFRLTELLETRITIRPMASVEAAEEGRRQERRQPLDVDIPARLEGKRLLAEWATWLKQGEMAMEVGGACSR